jgi:signal transduction histidine kinase/CheY-like chemotaxis protein
VASGGGEGSAANFDRVLLENLSTGVVACDENGQLVLFNRVLREWHGIGPTAVPMEEWASHYELFEADGAVPLATDRIPLVRAFHGEQVLNQPLVIKAKEGIARLVVANGGQLRAGDGSLLGAVVTMEDVTLQTRAQEEIRAANVRLRELLQRTEELARKAELANEAKSQFLATMSHELRTPMSGVLGMTDILAMTTLDAEQRGCLDLIRSSGESLLALINGILDFSKIEAGQLELDFHDFELMPLLRQLADTYAAMAAAKGLWLRLDCEADLPQWLHADSCRLQQVLVNLLNNAVKFTEEGGVTLSVRRSSEIPEWVSLRFAVRDTGIGIPADKRDLLFRRFSQLDASSTRKYGGTGLGLAICKQLVELFGGSIGVISPPASASGAEPAPTGSEFWFEVRLAKGRAGPKPSPSAHRPFTRRHRILVVEDNPVNRRMIVSMLQKLGLEAEWAENGQEALDRLNRAQFELILMDLQMPVMGGEQAARRIRALPEKHPARGVPIIAVSAHAFPEDKLRCLQAGMNDHVTKPIQLDRLEGVLRRWLERPLVESGS